MARQVRTIEYLTRLRHFPGLERDMQYAALEELGYRMGNGPDGFTVCIRNTYLGGASWDLWANGDWDKCMRWIRDHEAMKRV